MMPCFTCWPVIWSSAGGLFLESISEMSFLSGGPLSELPLVCLHMSRLFLNSACRRTLMWVRNQRHCSFHSQLHLFEAELKTPEMLLFLLRANRYAELRWRTCHISSCAPSMPSMCSIPMGAQTFIPSWSTFF